MVKHIIRGIAMAMAITADAAELTAKEDAIVDIGAKARERRHSEHSGECQALAWCCAEFVVPAHSARSARHGTVQRMVRARGRQGIRRGDKVTGSQ